VRVIVDTNVGVSGLISDRGAPARVVDAVLKGDIVPVMSEATFAELEDVLHRPELQVYLRRATVTPFQLLTELQQLAQFVKPRAVKTSIRDEKDRPFVELAASRPAADFIITGDKDFQEEQYQGVPVVTASLFATAVLGNR
jgi:putative PIN family toxin of toxin-antitoxin system